MENDGLKPKKFLSPFTIFVGIVFFGTIISNFYFLYLKKDYDFIVEVPCDSSEETCFQRDCSEESNCPPNNLSSFKRYQVRAADFKYCSEENCASACESAQIKCTLVACEEDIEIGESCSSFVEEPESKETINI